MGHLRDWREPALVLALGVILGGYLELTRGRPAPPYVAGGICVGVAALLAWYIRPRP